MANFSENLRRLRDDILGSPRGRKLHRAIVSRPQAFEHCLRRIGLSGIEHSGASISDSEPIFILSAGWRSGSTFLQRIISSESDYLIWGEPYAYSNLIPSLISQFMPFDENWPNKEWIIGDDEADVKDRWIANYYPAFDSLRASHIAFFETLFANVALEKGRKKWGLKEVRLGVDEALYLKWLFPRAKFLFLIRNPFDCFSSYRAMGMRSYLRWPDQPVFSPLSYADMWSGLAKDFVDNHHKVGGLLLGYETLNSAETRNEISSYLETEVIDPGSLPVVGAHDKEPVSAFELWLLRRRLGDTVRKLGYEGPTL